MHIRKSGAYDGGNLFDILWTATKIVACGIMADVVRAEQLVRSREVPLVHDFFEIATDDCFVCC